MTSMATEKICISNHIRESPNCDIIIFKKAIVHLLLHIITLVIYFLEFRYLK